MSENKNSARRRKAFADFKENQYDASFSLSKEQKRKRRASKIFRWIFIIIIIVLFAAAGFVLTDALLDISDQPYIDPNNYTASFTTTAPSEAQTENTTEENTTGESEENTELSQESASENSTRSTGTTERQ